MTFLSLNMLTALNNVKFDWTGFTFLIADDDVYSHLLLEKSFKNTGAHLLHAYNGLEAIHLVKNHTISLALIDIVMPMANGYDVANSLFESQPQTIAMAYTADIMRMDQEYCRKIGFHKCLIKPMLPVRLFKEIDDALKIMTPHKNSIIRSN